MPVRWVLSARRFDDPSSPPVSIPQGPGFAGAPAPLTHAFADVLAASGAAGSVDLLPTPALICEVGRLQRNIDKMQSRASAASIRLRPHFKSHKSALIAQRQLVAGAAGISCAKLSEAESLISAFIAGGVGAPAVLVTSPIFDATLATRAAELARSCDLTIALDDLDAVDVMGRAATRAGSVIEVVCDVDVGLGRTGVTASEQSVAIGRSVVAHNSLRFAGLQGYAGHAQHIGDRDVRRATVTAAAQRLAEHVDRVAAAGLNTDLRTGGGTGSWMTDIEDRVLNEIQAGSYLFMDREYADALSGDPEDCFEQSLFILTSVISANQPGFVTVDAGLKSMSTDAGDAVVDGDTGRTYHFFGDEHGLVTNGDGPRLRRGHRLRLVPPHCDPTVNLHDLIWLVDGDRVLGCTPVTARGRSY